MHHFVNGGGGAYLSFGTALQWPVTAATAEWAHYPSKQTVTDKIEARTPRWKWPAWWWTTRFNAWPFSAEWLSGIFDYNVAPFFQSFIEVRVEPSAHRVRLLPYGVYGGFSGRTWRIRRSQPAEASMKMRSWNGWSRCRERTGTSVDASGSAGL